MNRREFAGKALLGTGVALLTSGAHARAGLSTGPFNAGQAPVKPETQALESTGFATHLGEGLLSVLSDGQLQLPAAFLQPEGIADAELQDVLQRYQLSGDVHTPDCNISIWQQGARTVLFDVGAGSGFMSSVGQLPGALEAAGIDAESVTDVVLTHAHPDHLWGLLDDFDDMRFANAVIHIHRDELDYWRHPDTLHKTPEARQAFVVGAQSRLARAEAQLSVFNSGDELLPGIEAVDTRGHTPGHTSFALHQGRDSILIIGDALNNIALSFEYPHLHSAADQDPALAARTRMSLLERLQVEQTRFIGFHLPGPGLGHVERLGSKSFRFVAES